jgi:hypothetical protein
MGCAYRLITWRVKHPEPQEDDDADESIGNLLVRPPKKASPETFNGLMLQQVRMMDGFERGEYAKKIGMRESRLLEIEIGLAQPTYEEVTAFVDNQTHVIRSFFFQETETIDPPERMFVCGEGIQPCEICGQVSAFLCDYPIGVNKTCSKHLCESCRVSVGKLDFCPDHAKSDQGIRVIQN